MSGNRSNLQAMPRLVPALPAPPGELAFLLDVDGTILDIAPTPAEVRVSKSLLQTLARLDLSSGNALALVSGRSLADLDRIFAPLELAAIGGHGAEFRPCKGQDPFRGPAIGLPLQLRQRLAAIAALGPGIIVEDKGYSLALHYRLAPKLKAAIESAVAAIHAETAAESLELLPGKAVIEIKHPEFNKGAAVRRLMTLPPFAGRRPVFLGDDVTDESAFAVLKDFDGVGFSVGRSVPGLAGHFDAPRDVRKWLHQISTVQEDAKP